MIYGVSILAACMFLGKLIGNLLGVITGAGTDIGGVGFAMLLLLIVTNSKKLSNKRLKGYEGGIQFWQSMYIPVVIAMSATQNVYQALSGGIVALLAGVATVAVAFALLPLLNKIKIGNKEGEVETE